MATAKLTPAQRAYRANIRAGKCRYCGGKRTPGRKDCKTCETLHLEAGRAYRKRLKEETPKK